MTTDHATSCTSIPGELDRALQAYLCEVTLRVIRDEAFADASEAQEVPEALPPN
jgi:hypothetical protein